MPVIAVNTAQQIIDAVQNARAGDDIEIASGNYEFNVNINASAVGTDQQPIRVHGNGATGGVTLTFSTSSGVVEGFKVSGANWEFDHLVVKGGCSEDTRCEHGFHVQGAAHNFYLHDNELIDFNAQVKVNATMVGGVMTQPNNGRIQSNKFFDTRGRNTENPTTKINMDTGDGWNVSLNYIADAHKLNGDNVSYAAFMKSGGHRGTFERNFVVCDTGGAGTNGGTRIGLSFGGGGTGAQFCAPAYDASVPCSIEHTDGVIKNNVIMNCSDVGVYVNRGANTKVLFNTLIDTNGIDYRFDTTSGDAYGNVLSGKVRMRDGATVNATNNLSDVEHADFASWYPGAANGNFDGGTDVATAVGNAPARTEVTNDYCGRDRPSGTFTRGAIEHTLGDCGAGPYPPFDGGFNDDAGGGGGGGTGDDDGGGCCGTSANPASSLVLVALTIFGLRRRRFFT